MKNKYKLYISNHLPNPIIYEPIKNRINDFCYITYPPANIEGCNNLHLDLKKDNIFNLNIFFTEYAQLYYAWKYDNLFDIDYVGHFHYRRVFNSFIYDSMDEIFKTHDIITLHPELDINMEIRKEKIGIEFKNVFEKIVPNLKNILNKHNVDINDLYDTYGLYQCTIFVMSKDNFYKYCEWIFPILIDIARDLNLNLNQLSNNSYDITQTNDINLYTNYLEVKKELVIFEHNEYIKEYADKYIIPRLGGCIGEQLTSYYIYKKFNNIYYDNCWLFNTEL